MASMRSAVVLLALLLAVGCTPMHSQYNVRRSNLSCDQANRFAFQSLKSLGYAVTTFEPAAVELRPRGGNDKIMQVSIAEASKAIARAAAADLDPGIPGPTAAGVEATLRKRALAGGTLKPGGHAEGFVYFPVGSYARARA